MKVEKRKQTGNKSAIRRENQHLNLEHSLCSPIIYGHLLPNKNQIERN